MKEKRESFLFYASFWEAIKQVPRDVQGDVLTAIIEYGLYGETTEQLKPIAGAMFTLIKPQIDANYNRYENGKSGGAPIGNSNNTNGRRGKNQPRTNQEPTKNQPETNQEPTKNQPNVNDNVNVNDTQNVRAEFFANEISDLIPKVLSYEPLPEQKAMQFVEQVARGSTMTLNQEHMSHYRQQVQDAWKVFFANNAEVEKYPNMAKAHRHFGNSLALKNLTLSSPKQRELSASEKLAQQDAKIKHSQSNRNGSNLNDNGMSNVIPLPTEKTREISFAEKVRLARQGRYD